MWFWSISLLPGVVALLLSHPFVYGQPLGLIQLTHHSEVDNPPTRKAWTVQQDGAAIFGWNVHMT